MSDPERIPADAKPDCPCCGHAMNHKEAATAARFSAAVRHELDDLDSYKVLLFALLDQKKDDIVLPTPDGDKYRKDGFIITFEQDKKRGLLTIICPPALKRRIITI